MTRIAVLGAGAIGSSVAADLSAADHDVTVVDQWPAHVEAMKANGLQIRLPTEELRVEVNARHLCELAGLNPRFDIVLLAAKCYDTRWMTELVRPYLSDEGVVVGMQNGMATDAIAEIVGPGRTLGCVVELSGEIYEPGVVQRDTLPSGTWFGLGELDGAMTERLEEIQALLSNVARVDTTGNIVGAKWTKLIANSMTMGPFGLLGLKNWEAKELPGMFEVSVRLGRESMAVGRALGFQLEPVFGLTAEEFAGSSDDDLITAMKTLMAHVGKDSTTAPVHDHLKGRRSEMEYITGEVVRRGTEVRVPTPANTAVLQIDREINTGVRRMEPSNYEVLKARIEALDAPGTAPVPSSSAGE